MRRRRGVRVLARACACARVHARAGGQVLWGECIAGALYVNDFLRHARAAGAAAPARRGRGPGPREGMASMSCPMPLHGISRHQNRRRGDPASSPPRPGFGPGAGPGTAAARSRIRATRIVGVASRGARTRACWKGAGARRRAPSARPRVAWGRGGAGRVGGWVRGGGGPGFTDPRGLTTSPIEIHDPALRAVTGQAKFFSITSAPTPPHPTPRPPARRLSR